MYRSHVLLWPLLGSDGRLNGLPVTLLTLPWLGAGGSRCDHWPLTASQRCAIEHTGFPVRYATSVVLVVFHPQTPAPSFPSSPVSRDGRYLGRRMWGTGRGTNLGTLAQYVTVVNSSICVIASSWSYVFAAGWLVGRFEGWIHGIGWCDDISGRDGAGNEREV